MKKIWQMKFFLLFPIIVVVVGSLVVAGYFYQKYQKLKQNPGSVVKEETRSIVKAIGRFMELPNDEEPTLATVTDQEKLKDQEFFKEANNGDRVLIYAKSHKVILYRPATNRIIEFASLAFDVSNQSSTDTAQKVSTEPITVEIYNGTRIGGLTTEFEKKIKDLNGLIVVNKTNAEKNDYTKTLVIDVSGKNPAMVAQIARLVGGEVSEKIPDGEVKPTADVLIIAGK